MGTTQKKNRVPESHAALTRWRLGYVLSGNTDLTMPRQKLASFMVDDAPSPPPTSLGRTLSTKIGGRIKAGAFSSR